jgi:hypothetical protein
MMDLSMTLRLPLFRVQFMSCEEPSSWVKNILKLADNSLYEMYITSEITRSIYLRGILPD